MLSGCLPTNRGEPAIARETSRRILVFGWPRAGPDHEAVIRFDGEAPRRRAHSNERFDDHVPARVTTTSDRERPAGQDGSPKRADSYACEAGQVRPLAAARRRAGLHRW
jgi:hypothetical protein